MRVCRYSPAPSLTLKEEDGEWSRKKLEVSGSPAVTQYLQTNLFSVTQRATRGSCHFLLMSSNQSWAAMTQYIWAWAAGRLSIALGYSEAISLGPTECWRN